MMKNTINLERRCGTGDLRHWLPRLQRHLLGEEQAAQRQEQWRSGWDRISVHLAQGCGDGVALQLVGRRHRHHQHIAHNKIDSVCMGVLRSSSVLGGGAMDTAKQSV